MHSFTPKYCLELHWCIMLADCVKNYYLLPPT